MAEVYFLYFDCCTAAVTGNHSWSIYRVGALYHTKDKILKGHFLSKRENNRLWCQRLGSCHYLSPLSIMHYTGVCSYQNYNNFQLLEIVVIMNNILTASPFALCASTIFCPSYATIIIHVVSICIFNRRSIAGAIDQQAFFSTGSCSEALASICGTSTILFR